MHAMGILRRSLSSVFDTMHAARCRRLLGAVEALVQGRRLTLTDVARSWVGAIWVHAPLKALDRLLSNRHLHQARQALYRAMAVWMVRAQPVLLVDWSDLKHDGRWCLLRAAVPVGGRALTVYECIYPLKRMNHPAAQREFLRALSQVLPAGVIPVVVTDAGFRSDWFRAVQLLGWDFIGRVRSNTHVASSPQAGWHPCSSLHARATGTARDLGGYQIVKSSPLACRLVLVSRRRKARDQRTRSGTPQQGTTAKRARKSAREPWLLATSLGSNDRTAAWIVTTYAQRMQIETAFRDLKSHQYGMAFEDSQSRDADRLGVLLLLHALATFAAWVMAAAARVAAATLPDPMTRQGKHVGRYSWYRRGLVWLARPRIPPSMRDWITSRMPTDILDISLANAD